MKDDFEFLRGLANCQDKEQMARYIEEHQPKPMTNADRIRAMSDKELAFWLAERYVKEAVLQLKDKGVTPSATDIREVEERMYMVWARWLQQPAEDL